MVGAAEFVEFLVVNLIVDVADNALQTTVEQGLAHDVELFAQGVQDADATGGVEIGIVLEIFGFG